MPPFEHAPTILLWLFDASGRRYGAWIRGLALHVALLLAPGATLATTYVIDASEDIHIQVGGFASVRGDDQSSAPGQVLDLLGGPNAPPLQAKGNQTFEANENWISVQAIRNALTAGGLSTVDRLVIALGVNESGPLGSNSVMVDELDIQLQKANGSFVSFALEPDAVEVYNYRQGQTTAEALFEIDLGFDFMAEYDANSTETLWISSSISQPSNGYEIYFLSTGYTEAAIIAAGGGAIVPEPSTGLLLAGGLVLLATRSGRFRQER